MGRVLESYEGSNDVFRVVKLNTALGKTIRGREGGREGGCYVIRDCNAANIDVVALYLSERLNCNLYYTLEKLIFQSVYIFFVHTYFSVRR